MKRVNLKKLGILFALYIAIFAAAYHYSYAHAKINFEIKKVKASHGHAYGQVYYSLNNAYSPYQMYAFLHWWGFHHKYQSFTIPVYAETFNNIRLDPLSDAGEVVIRNVNVTEGAWFNKKVHPVDLNRVDPTLMHNLKIVHQESNLLHLVATGKDPHLVIAQELHIGPTRIDYAQLVNIGLFSFFILLTLVLLFKGFRKGYLRGEEILTVIMLLAYSTYTVLFGTQFKMAWLLIEYLPFIAILIILKQGLVNYLYAIRNIIFILVSLGTIVLIGDLANGTHTFSRYTDIIQNIASAMIIATSFIQKRRFNYHFYKYFLFAFTLFFGILTTMLHYYLFRIDTTIAFGFTMSMSEWAQKNYTFWYIFLVWGTVSFFHLRGYGYREKAALLLLLAVASVAVFTGYSASAKVAFALSLLVYLVLTYLPLSKKMLMGIAFLIAGYVLFFPWISHIFVMLKDLHHSLAGREGIFAIYSDLVKNNLLFGYGFNNTGSINTPQCVSPEIYRQYADNLFMKGCAPHSLPLLLWLNLGLVGMLPFSILLYRATKKLIDRTFKQNNQPALIAMIAAFITIITFSWGTWQPHALLTFSFFTGMILLSLNINTLSKNRLEEQDVQR